MVYHVSRVLLVGSLGVYVMGLAATSTVSADASCAIVSSATAYLYSDNSQIRTESSDYTVSEPSYAACNDHAQYTAWADAEYACEGHSPSIFCHTGIGYADVEWSLDWGGSGGGPVDQQYDCGDAYCLFWYGGSCTC
jgi:hypothetical protein